MKIKKIGLLAGVMALAAVIGAVAYTPKPTLAAVESATKNCVPVVGTPNVGICTLTVTDPEIINGSVFNVVLTGPAVFGTAAGQVTVEPTGALAFACNAAVTMLDPTNFRVTFTGGAILGGCQFATGFVVTERVTLTGAGLVQQTVSGITLATGAATVTVTGFNFVAPVTTAQVTLQKVCTNGVTGTFAFTVGGVAQNVTCGAAATAPFTVTPGAGNNVNFFETRPENVAATIACNVAGGTNAAVNFPGAGLNVVIVPGTTVNCIVTNVGPLAPVVVPVANLTPTAVTKACTTAAVAGQVAGTAIVGQPITCTVTVTFPATATGVTTQTATVTLSGGLTFSGGATSTTFTVPAIGPGGGTVTFTETIIPTVATTAGGAVPTQSITINGQAFNNITLTGIVGIALAAVRTSPAVTTINVDNCAVVAGSSTGIVTGTATSTGVNVTPGGSVRVRCELDLNDNDSVPGGVSSGIVSVTVGNNAGGLVIANITSNGVSGTVNAGQTANVVCGRTVAGAVTVDGCDRVTVEFTVPANETAPFTRAIQITANYVPDETLINTPAALASTTVFTVNTVIALNTFRGPVNLRISCANSGLTEGRTITNSIVPASLGSGGNFLAVGVLPGAVACQVIADGPFAPGTIEVSSLNGSLIDLSGRTTTNLRIGCGTNPTVDVSSSAVINLNTCVGVQFGVLGLGVGTVELRARYEPTGAAAAAGVREAEATGSVAFVAPTVFVSLALAPNPVAVGQTGVATASLGILTVPQCGSITSGGAGSFAATATGDIVASVAGTFTTPALNISFPCIDPATGLGLTSAFTSGSILNGFVVFTIEDTAIARFQETGIANAGTTLNAAVGATANQVVRNCGAFSGGSTATFQNIGGIAAGSGLAPFFGGCQTATATYVGVNPGATNIAATFIPFLPGAQSALSGFTGTTSGLTLGAGLAGINFFGQGVNASTFRVLQVAGVAPTGDIQLARGCNNVAPTVTESVAAFIARVTPANVVLSVFEYQTATSRFTGAPGPASPASAAAAADLTGVTRLRPVFVCVTAPATLAQPAA